MTARRLRTDPIRSALMRRVRRANTKPEAIVAEACQSLGMAYRRNVCSLPGSPDLANKSRRWAIFVNGCYWHHHTGCHRATVPKRNRPFWTKKFRENRRRDARKIHALRGLGFRIVLIWECETTDTNVLRKRLSQLREARVV